MLLLKPFEAIPDATEVRAEARAQANQLIFEYTLSDPKQVVLDGLEAGDWKSWPRADGLWKTTCFEAFVGRPGEPGYYEFNFSPAKKSWNVYRFETYRSPQPPLPSQDFELKAVSVTPAHLKCILQAKISPLGMECSLTAVIRREGGVSYHALTHAAPQPDFHRRESFSLRL